MFRGHRIDYKSLKYFSSITKAKTILDPNSASTEIKSGYISFIRLDSDREICLIRPPNMKSIFIYSELLDKLVKDDIKCVSHHGNLDVQKKKSIEELTSDGLEPVKTSIFEFMPQKLETLNWQQRFETYGKLGKLQLTTLVAVSCICGTLMAPVPFELSTILLSGLGTFCTAMAANTINQILEIPYDSQMKRTKSRPLVLGKITPFHAAMFAITSGISGSLLLCYCNPLACILGLSNLVLYTSIYTPFKRISIANTWLGAIVGGIPPLIGWTAATNSICSGGLLISAMLFCWQFPHFMALSWNLKSDYSKAGYQMASIVSPSICKGSSFRHSILISILCPLAPMAQLTDWCFPIEILPFNIALCVMAYQFYSNPTSSSSRRLFRYTLIYLPILMTLLILNKFNRNNDKVVVKDVS